MTTKPQTKAKSRNSNRGKCNITWKHGAPPSEAFIPLVKLIAKWAAEDEFIEKFGYLPGEHPSVTARRKQALVEKRTSKETED